MLWFGAIFALILATTVVGVTRRANELSPAMLMLPIGQLVLLFVWFGLEAFYLVHVYRSPRLGGWNRVLWAAVVGLGGPLGWPVYWYVNIWSKPRPAAPATSEAALGAGELTGEST
jgi:hypothetical protein